MDKRSEFMYTIVSKRIKIRMDNAFHDHIICNYMLCITRSIKNYRVKAWKSALLGLNPLMKEEAQAPSLRMF